MTCNQPFSESKQSNLLKTRLCCSRPSYDAHNEHDRDEVTQRPRVDGAPPREVMRLAKTGSPIQEGH